MLFWNLEMAGRMCVKHKVKCLRRMRWRAIIHNNTSSSLISNLSTPVPEGSLLFLQCDESSNKSFPFMCFLCPRNCKVFSHPCASSQNSLNKSTTTGSKSVPLPTNISLATLTLVNSLSFITQCSEKMYV